jgi:ribosome maturation factor RimP
MVQVFAQRVQGVDFAALQAVIAPVLRAHAVEVAEITHQMERAGWVLRVVVEALEGTLPDGTGDGEPLAPLAAPGISLGLLTDISRDLSSALDVADVIPHRYTLEVSSPGLDRPLRTPRDFQRAVGVLVKIHLHHPLPDGQRVLRGTLAGTDETALTLEVDGKLIQTEPSNVERAHTIFELPAQPKRKKPTKNQRH